MEQSKKPSGWFAVLGRAVTDEKFREQLLGGDMAVIEKYDLTEEELNSFKSMEIENWRAIRESMVKVVNITGCCPPEPNIKF